ncbi:TPA: hypothetical protein HA318_02890 [Candidatus Micrarchaeota archaeon]|nr:MAG: hypothetical protein AUJ65_01090 [Candidatus Micrarchaeota archaeon CG1_02_51_15]HII38925.1 hypothetical protein [Candidatus Micrarchaeota archaeon]
MEKIIVIGDKQTALGFGVAGVKDSFEAKNNDAEELTAQVLAREDAGILVVTTEVMDSLSLKTRKTLQESSKPVVIVIPSTRESVGKGDDIAAMVKKAIGIELK